MTMPEPLDVRRTFQEARTLALVGMPDAALVLLDQMLAAVPGSLEALALRSEVLRKEGRDQESLAAADQAVARWPLSAIAHDARARILDKLGRAEEALAEAEEALRHVDTVLPGEAAGVFLTVVTCLRQARRYREALAIALAGHERTGDAVLAEWAAEIERELAAAERERC
jgi:predicted Zn-dependent protease